MQLMLNLYDLSAEPDPTSPPMEFWVASVRAASAVPPQGRTITESWG